MRLLWTLVKIVVVLALAIPAALIAMSLLFGLFGAVLGLAFFALRLAVIALCVYGVFRLGVMIFGGRKRPDPQQIRESYRPVDPYYEAAKRELDQEMGDVRS